MNGLRLLGIERGLDCWVFKDVQVVGFSGLSKMAVSAIYWYSRPLDV